MRHVTPLQRVEALYFCLCELLFFLSLLLMHAEITLLWEQIFGALLSSTIAHGVFFGAVLGNHWELFLW